MTKPLLIAKAGDAPAEIVRRHGDFEDLFIRLGRVDPAKAVVVHAARGETPDRPEAYSGAIITGSPAMVTDRLPWSENLAAWLRRAMDAALPLLAVCYGHQLLAHALGGGVDYHSSGPESGTKTIRLLPPAAAHPFLANLPANFTANLSHSQTVVRVPAGGVVLAGSDHDAQQIIGYGDTALSVQFHPEFDGAVMCTYLAMKTESSSTAGARLPAEAANTPIAQGILEDFVKSLAADLPAIMVKKNGRP